MRDCCDSPDPLSCENKEKERQRAETEAKVTWIKSFRFDLCQAHLKREHPTSILSSHTTIRSTSSNAKWSLNTILHLVHHDSESIHLILNPDIVDVFICDMFFHPDDHGEVTQTATKNLFHQFEHIYRVIISNRMQF
jgi:hypothetical protein